MSVYPKVVRKILPLNLFNFLFAKNQTYYKFENSNFILDTGTGKMLHVGNSVIAQGISMVRT